MAAGLCQALVLIARELHTRILVTTHSPYFLQALQTYMTDTGQADRFHVYVPSAAGASGSYTFHQASEDDLDGIIADMEPSVRRADVRPGDWRPRPEGMVIP